MLRRSLSHFYLTNAAAPNSLRRTALHTSSNSLARVLISDAIEDVCSNIFTSRGHTVDMITDLKKEDLLRVIPEYDGLVVRSSTKVTSEVLEAAANLKVVGRAGTGVDNIDVKEATKRGILVVNTPGGNTTSTAELTLSHILALARNIPQAVSSVKEGKWERKKYTGSELQGKTLGIIGVGRIGREVARWCQALGMKTIGYDPVISDAAARDANIEPVPLDTLWAQADYITVHTPLTADTKKLINAKTLSKCKQGVRIVNCARGGIIDEAALLEALKSGQVAGASLDVLEEEPPSAAAAELIKHPNLLLTPHLGASTTDAQLRVAHDIAVQMSDIFEGQHAPGLLNAPNMALAKQHPVLRPYIQLAELLGSIQSQLIGRGRVKRVVISLNGRDLSKSEFTSPLESATLKGALTHLISVNREVNYINAKAIGEEYGLAVDVRFSPTTPAAVPYANTLELLFEMDGSPNHSISGTVIGGEDIRIVSLDGMVVDVPTSEHMLVYNNEDKPGAISAVCSTLAAAKINIAHFSLGRASRGQLALGVLTLDDPVSASVLESLQELPFLSNVHAVTTAIGSASPMRIFGDGVDSTVPRPAAKPSSPAFSSGPCKKRPGYDLAALPTVLLGRSHRSKEGKALLRRAIDQSKAVLGIPADYHVAIVPASDTGAFEAAMWSMLGERPVDVAHWESFGKGWYTDCRDHLKLEQLREFQAPYGSLPDLTATNPMHDVVFTWNGTTSGVKVPNGDWIADDREGLTFVDATSAAFAMQLPWPKIDVATYSWQKVLGGEGGHGMIILSPRAVARLQTFTPPGRPLPKIFRMTKKQVLDEGLFQGSTINTPSLLCVEDYIDALDWAESIGGLETLIQRSNANFKAVEDFVNDKDWIDFLAKSPENRSNTSVCLTLPGLESAQIKKMTGLLEKEGVAYDIGAYRDAPPGLRVWCGATVEEEDVAALMPWLEWARGVVVEDAGKA